MLLPSIEASLQGLLSLHIDEHIDSSIPWLTVHLHFLKRSGKHAFQAAIEAMAQLHCLTNASMSITTKAALWTTILTSSMMTLPLLQINAKVVRFIRYLYRSPSPPPVQIALDWTGTAVDAVACPLLLRLFEMRRPPTIPPLVVGLTFKKCRVTAQAINVLDSVFADVKNTMADDRLVDVHSLGRLDFTDNGLSVASLEALAVLLDRQDVHDVRLDNILMISADEQTVASITLVLTSLFSPAHGQNSSVSVSFANNSLDHRYYKAIAKALEVKTRPLRRLSLERTMSLYHTESREGCWHWLASIMLSTNVDASQGDNECELDLSGCPLYPNDMMVFRQHVTEMHALHLGLLQDALNHKIPVLCWLNSIATGYVTPTDSSDVVGVLDQSRPYQVQAVSANGFILVDGELPNCWVKYQGVTKLQIGDSFLSRYQPRFTALVLNEMRVNTALHYFLAAIGSNLRRLSARHVDANDFLPRSLLFTPHIAHLDLEASRLSDITELVEFLQQGHARELETLNLNGNPLGFRSMERLVVLFVNRPDLKLRQLQVRFAHIGAIGLVHVESLLEMSKTLELVELDMVMTRGDDEDVSYSTQRAELTTRFDNQLVRAIPLPLRSRLAFLSVAGHVEMLKAMDVPVASLVLEFAATHVTRNLIWN